MKHVFLEKIIESKQKEVGQAKARLPLDKIIDMLAGLSGDGKIKNHSQSKRDFAKAAGAEGKINLIAEIKKASPSKGLLRPDFNPVGIAVDYQSAGASALSVVTDESFFGGHNSILGRVKEAVGLPVLKKDFIIDEYQIYQSALIEADCILLIADILDEKSLRLFTEKSESLNMEVLIESHTEDALKKALSADTNLIGINNRDLHDFSTDIKTTQRMIKSIPKGKIIVSESGIKTRDDIKFLQSLGVNAVLIGEAFMTAQDIKAKVKELMG